MTILISINESTYAGNAAAKPNSAQEIALLGEWAEQCSPKKTEVLVCVKCKGPSPRIPQHEDLMTTIAISLIDKPSGLAGDEMRLLRKYLGERNGRFAQTLGIDPSHLSKINNGQLPISRQTARPGQFM